MTKDAFNSVSGRENSIAGPIFQSDFVKKDKHGRTIKTEEDIKTARIRMNDGGYMTVRAGKPIGYEAPPETKSQQDKKAALTSSEDRRAAKVKQDLQKKARNLHL